MFETLASYRANFFLSSQPLTSTPETWGRKALTIVKGNANAGLFCFYMVL